VDRRGTALHRPPDVSGVGVRIPTPPAADMPGIRFWMPLTFREEGIAEMTSRSMICCVRALCTSTIGVSP
jgi:hypothetical protein